MPSRRCPGSCTAWDRRLQPRRAGAIPGKQPHPGHSAGNSPGHCFSHFCNCSSSFQDPEDAAGAKRLQVADVSVTACDFIPEFTFPAGLSVAAVSQCPQGQFWAPAPSHGPGPRFTLLPSRSGKKPQCRSPLLLCFHSALIFTSLSGIFLLRRVTLYPNWNVPWLALRRFD